MPITYVLDQTRDFIMETWTGTIAANDLESYWQVYLADPDVLACRRTLVDMRDATINFTGVELAELVQRVAVPALNGLQWITALLVGRPSQHGTSRQYHVFAEQFSSDAIFYDEDAALVWLIQQSH